MAHKLIIWHPILQMILDDQLELMSGKRILEKGREVFKFYQIDYFCRTGRGKPRGRAARVTGTLPFDHLLEYNVFEYKSINETLNDRTFRNYVARALMFESCHLKTKSLRGRLTLTIVLTRLPSAVLKDKTYEFTKLTPWKYYCNFKGLPVYILIQREMRGVDGGEPLAYLQVLEGDPGYQRKTWRHLIGQNLGGENYLKDIMIKISEEAYMTIQEQIIEEVRPGIFEEGKEEGRAELLLKLASINEFLPKYEQALASVKTPAELALLVAEIMGE